MRLAAADAYWSNAAPKHIHGMFGHQSALAFVVPAKIVAFVGHGAVITGHRNGVPVQPFLLTVPREQQNRRVRGEIFRQIAFSIAPRRVRVPLVVFSDALDVATAAFARGDPHFRGHSDAHVSPDAPDRLCER